MTFDPSPYRELYPWQGRHLDVGQGVRMHYLDEGRGEPLVMLHGNPTWSFYWRNLVKGLSGSYRCLVPDHVGCGLSDKPADNKYTYVLDRRVTDLEAMLEQAGVTKDITLVVHDWGGMIGLAFATKHPERIKRIIALNTAGFGLPEGRSLPWQIAVVRRMPWFSVPVRGLNAFSRGANLTCSTRPGRMTPLVKRAYLAPYDSWANRIAVQRFVEDIPLVPGDPSWATVNEVSQKLGQFSKIPVLVCWGRRDFVFNDAFLAEWRKRLPNAEVHTFDDAGHYVLEDAHEEILPIVRDFLSKHPLNPS
ncbi:MAG: alpha/beta fold hydrolase [Archangium sp.]|nr:alpha/beta fold hydrolase [Archangium sp.]